MVKKATKERIKVFYDYIEKSKKLKDMSLVFSPRLEEATLTANAKLKKDDIVLFKPLELVYLNDLFRSARKSGHVSMRRELFAVELKEREQEAILKYSFEDKQYVGELEKLVGKYLDDFEKLNHIALRPVYIYKESYSRLTDNQKRLLDETYSLFAFNDKFYLSFKDENIEKNVKLAVTNQPMALLLNYVTPDYHNFVLLLNRHLGVITQKGLYDVLNTTQDALPSKDFAKHKEMLTRGIDALATLSIIIKDSQAYVYKYNQHTRTKQEGYSK